MISNAARRLSGLKTPMLNLLRGKNAIDRVDASTGRVIRSMVSEGKLRSAVISAYGGRFIGRHATMDADRMAFTYRMGNGSAGSVNRFHPATITPTPINGTTPPSIGLAGTIDATANNFRLVQAGDTGLTDIWGVTVRPWPVQQGNSASPNFVGAVAFGGVQPVAQQFGVWDVLRSGYILVPVVGAPVLGGTVYVWCAVASGSHVQGGFESATPGGSGFTISGNDKTNWNSGADAFGVAELAFNI